MTDYKEILRLSGLGINNSQIAAATGCSRTTVIDVLRKAAKCGVTPQSAAKARKPQNPYRHSGLLRTVAEKISGTVSFGRTAGNQ